MLKTSFNTVEFYNVVQVEVGFVSKNRSSALASHARFVARFCPNLSWWPTQSWYCILQAPVGSGIAWSGFSRSTYVPVLIS